MANLQYLSKVVKTYLDRPIDRTCPYCHQVDSRVLGRKYYLVQLRQCQNCGLMFRFPKDRVEENYKYYQNAYREGLTTDLPSSTELKYLLDTYFQGTSKDFSKKIELVKTYVSGGKALDYGCSWGYGVWQLNRAGFEATGFEISRPRAEFGRKQLEIDVIDKQEELENLPHESFDLIFTSHVLEHLPDISNIFSLFYGLLKEKGILAIFVPDCDNCNTFSVFKQKRKFAFGEKHAIAFHSSFLEYILRTKKFMSFKVESNVDSGFPELIAIAQK